MKASNHTETITIVGKGTVGCLTLLHFYSHTDWNIDWIFDPSKEAWAVGEGTTLTVPDNLERLLEYTNNNLYDLKGTPKLGIWKEGWTNDSFMHPFPLGQFGIHINARELQQKLYEYFSNSDRVNIISKKIENYNTIDTEYTMICDGIPKELNSSYKIAEGIPVNSAYITQCYWDIPQFLYSLTIARPYGWVFGIPLQNRCSIGYIYNANITKLNEVKEDLEKVFNQYGLKPSEDTNHIKFLNYTRKDNFFNNFAYNGTASFFLEPLEATSLANADYVNKIAWDVFNENMTTKTAQKLYKEEISRTEFMISMHYLSKNNFKTDFWDFAKTNSQKYVKEKVLEDEKFRQYLYDILQDKSDKALTKKYNTQGWGNWTHYSWKYNIEKLKLKGELGAIT